MQIINHNTRNAFDLRNGTCLRHSRFISFGYLIKLESYKYSFYNEHLQIYFVKI